MALSYVGSAAGTTSATLPAFAAGDLALVFAFRDGVATAPSLPAGWDDVISGAASTCAERVGTRQLQSGDTTTGTWTNATSVIVHVLRPTGGRAIVGASAQGGSTATSVTYPALTLQDASGSSWVIRQAGHRSVNTTLENPPTGYTFRLGQVNGSVDELATFDSNGGVGSNPTATAVAVGGTASGWRATTIEIRFEPTRTAPVYRDSLSSGDSSFSTRYCNVPAPTVAIGDLELIECAAAFIAPTAAPIMLPPAGWNYPPAGLTQYGPSSLSAGGVVNTRPHFFWRISPDTGSVAQLDAGANAVFVYTRSSYSNADPTNPIRNIVFNAAGAATSVVMASMNAVADAMLHAFISLGAAQTVTPPGSMTARQNNGTYGVMIAEEVLTATGQTSTRTFAYGTSSESIWSLAELRGAATSGGTTYNETLSESVTAGAAQGSAAVFPVTRTESVTAGDALAVGVVITQALAEAITPSDAVAPAVVITGAISENVSVADALASIASFTAAYTESVTPADSHGGAQLFVASLTDTVALADQYSSSVAGGSTTYNETISESLTLADCLVASQVMVSTLAESTTLGDALVAAGIFGANLTEQVSPGDALAPGLVIPATLAESVSPGDTVGATVVFTATLSEAIALADALGATQVMLSAVGENINLVAAFDSTVAIPGGYPDPADVRLGVSYGPTGVEYVGTFKGGKGTVWVRRR